MLRNITRSLLLLFVINIAFGLTNQLINPLFPLYLDKLGASEVQNAFVISMGGLVATFLMLPSGLIIDRVGKKTMIALSTIGISASIYLMSLSGSWTLLIPYYILYSAIGALFIPARMALISERASPENRASLFGIMNLAWPVSGVIAPIISGYVIEHLGWKSVFYLSMALSLVSFIPALMIEEKKEVDKTLKFIEEEERGSVYIKDYLPALMIFFFFQFVMTSGLGGLNMIIPLYLSDRFHLSPSNIGLFFTGSSLITLITQMPSGYLADRYGRKKLTIACVLTIPLFFVIWVFVTDWLILLIAYSIAYGLWSMTWPATLALIAEAVPIQLQGAAFGVRMTGVRLGFTVGPLIASSIYSNYNMTDPFVVGTILFTLGVLFAFKLKE
jgi:MFS family permease